MKSGATSGAIAGIGLKCAEGSLIERNQVRESFYGMYFEELWDSKVDGNVAMGSTDSGIYFVASKRNVVTHNIATNNSGQGIFLASFSDNNTIQYNNASGNGTGGGIAGIVLENSNYNNVSNNTASDNWGDGIFVDGISNGNTLDWNQCASNSNIGIHFGPDTFDNVYSFNRAKGNSEGYSDETCATSCLNDNADTFPSNR